MDMDMDMVNIAADTKNTDTGDTVVDIDTERELRFTNQSRQPTRE